MKVEWEKQTVVKEVVENIKTYVAFDGTKFTARTDCEKYEEKCRSELLSGIETCSAINGHPGFDGECHDDSNSYAWYHPVNADEIQRLNKCFEGADLSDEDIGQWIGIESNDDDRCCGVSYLDSCIKYARNLLASLGYEMHINPISTTPLPTAKFPTDKGYVLPLQGGYLDIRASCDPDYPGMDLEFISDKENADSKTRPRVLVEQNREDGQLRVLVWADPNSEDYSESIDLPTQY